MARRRQEIPKPPIAEVLRELGADPNSIPTGYGWVRMSCPFHEDRTPSAAVNHDVDGFKCHSCGRSGDALKLLQNELRLPFREAADRASALTTEPSRGTSKRRTNRRPSDLLKRGNE